MPTLAKMMRGRQKPKDEPWRQDLAAELGTPDHSDDDAYFAELMAQQQTAGQPEMAQAGAAPPQQMQPPAPLAQMMRQGAQQQRPPIQQMPPLPEAVQQAARNRKTKPKQASQVDMLTDLLANDLWTVQNSGAMKPSSGEGFVAWRDLPPKMLEQMPPSVMEQSPLGWRLADLSPQKKMLLMQLRAMGDADKKRRIDAVQLKPEDTQRIAMRGGR